MPEQLIRQNSSGYNNNINNDETTMQKMTLNFENSNKKLDQYQYDQMQGNDENDKIDAIRSRINSTFDDLE